MDLMVFEDRTDPAMLTRTALGVQRSSHRTTTPMKTEPVQNDG